MTRTNHRSLVEARRELIRAGYRLAHSPPDSPELWLCKHKPDMTIGREDRPQSSVWHIVNYPEVTT